MMGVYMRERERRGLGLHMCVLQRDEGSGQKAWQPQWGGRRRRDAAEEAGGGRK